MMTARDPRKPGQVPWRWIAVLGGVLMVFVFGTGLTVSPDDAGVGGQAVASVALVGVMTIVVVGCVCLQRRHGGEPLLGWPGWRRFILELAIAVPVALGWALALSAVAAMSPELRALMDPGETLTKPVILAPVVYCVAGFTLVPVAEEMFYRGVLYRRLRVSLPGVVAFAGQAVFFGAMHPHGRAFILMAIASGLLFMGLALWRRTLWSPVLTHALINAVGAVPLLVAMLATSDDVMFGVTMENLSGQSGCRVVSVFSGSPAEEAGLEKGDVITAIAGRAVEQGNDVAKSVLRRSPGEELRVEYRRAGEDLETEAALRRRRPYVLW